MASRFLPPEILLVLVLLPIQASHGTDKPTVHISNGITVSGHFSSFQEEGLSSPYFWDFVTGIYEKEIVLGYVNPNEDSQTEIWISRSPDDGFILARVEGPAEGQQVYFDDTRSPRTTYYFKLRAIRGDLKSDFSGITSFTTGSEFFPPEITAEATGPETIDITFHDRSYNDVSYTIWKEGPGPEFRRSFSAADSGQVFHFTDEFLEPDQTYVYWVDAYTEGPNMPRYIAIVNVTVTTPAAPILFGFALIDADRDVTVMDLNAGDEVFAPEHPNIMAFANEETGSVVFFLNGAKRVENVPPYSYFYDTNGDFKSGNLPPGEYQLSATPFTGNNGKGTSGTTIAVNFTVRLPSEHLEIESFTLVDPATDTDIGELNDGDEVDASSQPNIRANAGSAASSVVFFLNGVKRTENEKPYAYFYDRNGDYRPGNLSPGSYTLEATAFSGNNAQGESGRTHTIHFTVKENAEETSFAALDLFPNPIVSDAVLQVTGTPGELVEINVMDTSGNSRRALEIDALDGDGMLRKTLSVGTLPRGNYLLRVSVNGKATVKRFVIQN